MIRVIDVETTGLPPDAAVCEIGWCDVDTDTLTVSHQWGVLCDPQRPIPPEVRAVHHISNDDVMGKIIAPMAIEEALSGTTMLCAHNADFERQFIKTNVPWICTYKVGLRIWPEMPGHGNQVLRYCLGLELPDAHAMPPHRAAPDAFVTAHILCKALATGMALETMVSISNEPALLVKCGFGKHRGQKWETVPTDYLDWLLRQKDMDASVHHTARHHLKKRTTR